MFLFGFESGFVRDPVPSSLEGFKQVDISETQKPNPQAWAPGSEGWALKSLAPGGGEEKKKKTETGRP